MSIPRKSLDPLHVIPAKVGIQGIERDSCFFHLRGVVEPAMIFNAAKSVGRGWFKGDQGDFNMSRLRNPGLASDDRVPSRVTCFNVR